MNPRSEWQTRRLRARLAERDGWACYQHRHGRCLYEGAPIPPAARYPHGMSLSLEHVLPEGVTLKEWTDSGQDPFDPRVCTVSHRACNSKAGASIGGKRAAAKKLATSIRTALTW